MIVGCLALMLADREHAAVRGLELGYLVVAHLPRPQCLLSL